MLHFAGEEWGEDMNPFPGLPALSFCNAFKGPQECLNIIVHVEVVEEALGILGRVREGDCSCFRFSSSWVMVCKPWTSS